MQTQESNPFIFSQDFEQIVRADLKNWCLHLICLNGTGSFVYNDSLYSIRKNDIAIVPHIEHIAGVNAESDLKVMFVLGDLKFINAQLPQNHYGIKGEHSLIKAPVIHASAKEIAMLKRDFLNIKERLKDKNHFYYTESLGAASLQMTYDLFEAHKKWDEKAPGRLSAESKDIPQGAASVVKHLTRILESGETMTHREVSYYAERLNVSPKYLCETVRRLTGKSVTYLINRYAGPIIARLLKDDSLSVTQIAYRMGFSGVSYFSRYTKRVLGMSPAEFRRRL